ncbi:helix-turn-helix domain-containing protein [Phaeacidiphilus oryzae]|uniref:helix-turn-helix domain-containing protein n=1 Tax=Phaeacidiphilus oryzae TaxID=348818 RepID=UPI000566BFF5|nr:helix-turn-helix domain-containing protein [Phaeacidiphilus oryzae]
MSESPAAPTTDQPPTAIPAAESLRRALTAHPGATAAELATAAGIGRSTAGKILASLEKHGTTRRENTGRDTDNRATADHWHPVTAAPAAATQPTIHPRDNHAQAKTSATAPTTPLPTRTEPPAPRPTPPPIPRPGRLGQGELRTLVIDHFRAHPHEQHSPTGIAKALSRSAGAVANACARAESDDIIDLVSAKPKRYALRLSPPTE